MPLQDSFRPETFQRKSGLRDYAIYALMLLVLVGVIGGGVYYFTRSPKEKNALQAKFGQTFDQTGADGEMKPVTLKQDAQLNGIVDGSAAPAATTDAEPKPEQPKLAGSSAYAGGRPTRVLPSDNPKLPPASPEFLAFAEGLKVSGVFQGNPAKAMLNGKLFRAGDEVEAELGVKFVSVEPVKRTFLLRDKSGAELRLTY